MKIDTTKVLIGTDGQPVRVPDEGSRAEICPTCGQPLLELVELTLREAAIRALANMQRGQQLSNREKLVRAVLAQRFLTHDELTLNNDDAKAADTAIGEFWAPWVYLQCHLILDPDDEVLAALKDGG